jgi:hypothetical protein
MSCATRRSATRSVWRLAGRWMGGEVGLGLNQDLADGQLAKAGYFVCGQLEDGLSDPSAEVD